MRLESQPTWKLWVWEPQEGAADSAIKEFVTANSFRYVLLLIMAE